MKRLTARPHLVSAAVVALVVALVAAFVFVSAPAKAARVATVPATLRILAIGESLTQGTGSPDGCGYRTEVTKLAAANGTNIVWTGPPNNGLPYNPGIDCSTGWRGGATLDVLTNGINGWLASDTPDVVIILIGTNNASGAGNGMTNFQQDYTGLIQTILNWSPTVHVFPMMIPYSSASWATNEVYINVDIIGAAWSFIGGPNANRVTLVDVSGYPTREMRDGLHPSDYTPIADRLFSIMAPFYGWKPPPYGGTIMYQSGPCRPGFERQPLQWTCPE